MVLCREIARGTVPQNCCDAAGRGSLRKTTKRSTGSISERRHGNRGAVQLRIAENGNVNAERKKANSVLVLCAVVS